MVIIGVSEISFLFCTPVIIPDIIGMLFFGQGFVSAITWVKEELFF